MQISGTGSKNLPEYEQSLVEANNIDEIKQEEIRKIHLFFPTKADTIATCQKNLDRCKSNMEQCRKSGVALKEAVKLLDPKVIYTIEKREMESVSDVVYTLGITLKAHPLPTPIDMPNGDGWEVTKEFIERKAEFKIFIELKPAVGDDYPAILRQMKDQKRRARQIYCVSERLRHILAYDKFTAKRATLQQVRTIFAEADIYMVNIGEVLAA